MRRHNRIEITSLFVVLLIAALFGGCKPEYEQLSISPRTSPPSFVDVRSEPILLTAGAATLVEVDPISAKRKDYEDDTVVELDSLNQNIFDVRSSIEAGEFVLIGVAPGTTCMQVRIDGHFEECINVQVVTPIY
ncbi:MAG: hypothetical protein GY847_11445 [Proteobacteria bacterium]|nr:hypothetical protein [Pseudomonadota bacterium]